MAKNTGRGTRIGTSSGYYGHGAFMKAKENGGSFKSPYSKKSIWERMLSWFGVK